MWVKWDEQAKRAPKAVNYWRNVFYVVESELGIMLPQSGKY